MILILSSPWLQLAICQMFPPEQHSFVLRGMSQWSIVNYSYKCKFILDLASKLNLYISWQWMNYHCHWINTSLTDISIFIYKNISTINHNKDMYTYWQLRVLMIIRWQIGRYFCLEFDMTIFYSPCIIQVVSLIVFQNFKHIFVTFSLKLLTQEKSMALWFKWLCHVI